MRGIYSVARVCALFLSAGLVQAATLYEYAGNTYNSISDSASITGAYDASMRVEASFLVSSELTEMGFTDISALVLEYSFSDGRNTLTHLNSTLTQAGFAVDAAGEFTGWSFTAVTAPAGLSFVGDMGLAISTTSVFDVGAIDLCLSEFPAGGCSLIEQDSAVNTAGPGTWLASTVVPIPAAAWLFGSALLGLGWLRRL